MAWVDAACGFFGKEQSGTLKPDDAHLNLPRPAL
jgi:hypothetical protein